MGRGWSVNASLKNGPKVDDPEVSTMSSSSGIDFVTAQSRRTVDPPGPSPSVHAPPARGRQRAYLLTKRTLDIAVALGGLVLLAPLLLLIALAVRLTSRGPVLFRQTRPGHRGKPFQILKFRTMVEDAEARLTEVLGLNEQKDHSLIRIREDPRVTRVGSVLRKTSLDELPQLLNILRGDMSLVGPRPISRPIPDERGRLRLEAVPGLTGYWQISGRKNTDCSYMLEKDMEYLEKRSLWFDLLIVLRTIPAVLGKNGAK